LRFVENYESEQLAMKWQQEDERLAEQGLKNPYNKFRGRLGPFMRARSKLTESKDVSFYTRRTLEVAQRVLRESSEDSNVRGKTTPSPRPYKQRSNEVAFMVFPVS
jgi:hypothetical protein